MALPASSWGSCVVCGVSYYSEHLKDGVCEGCQGQVPPEAPAVADPTDSELKEILGTEGGYDADDQHIQ